MQGFLSQCYNTWKQSIRVGEGGDNLRSRVEVFEEDIILKWISTVI